MDGKPDAAAREAERGAQGMAVLRLLVYSGIGIVLFFVPFEMAGKSSLLIDHAASLLHKHARPLVLCLALAFMLHGALSPWLPGNRQRGAGFLGFSLLKGLGLLVGVAYLLGWGPAALYRPDMLPFLFEKLVMTLTVIIPVGALALAFLIGFGLLELIGVLMQPVMRPVWRTPGKSAIDAVASFAGSYSIGLLITERLYCGGHYSLRDAAIIATGFSTVSMPFMVVVAKTLELMPSWNLFFWSAFGVTFLVTALTARMPPLARLPDDGKPDEPLPAGQGRLAAAWQAGVQQAASAPPLPVALWSSLKDGLRMTSAILPSILAVGLLGLLAAHYTPLFDLVGLLFLPLTWALGLAEPMRVAGALASGLAEMFLPVVLLKDADGLVRFTAGVVSVSSILFLSASIPCMLATRIPLRLRDLLLVWGQRSLLSLLLAVPIGWLAQAQGWL